MDAPQKRMFALFHKKNRIAVDIQRLFTSSVLINALILVRNILTARLLGPYWTGVCLGLMSVPQVANYLNLGITESLKIEVPKLRERGGDAAVADLKNSVFNYFLIPSVFMMLVIIGYALFFSSQGPKLNALLSLAGVIILLDQLKNFFSVEYASEKRFLTLSWFEFLFALATLLLSVIAILLFHVYGYWIGMILSYALVILFALRGYLKRYPVIFRKVDFKIIRTLIPLGITMVLSTIVYTPFMVTAKLFLTFTLGPEAVGLFLLSIIIITKVEVFSRAVGGVLMPHLTTLHTRSGALGSILPIFIKAQAFNLVLSLFIVLAGHVLLKPIVAFILPQYLAGVPAAETMLFACIPYGLLNNANMILVVSENKRSYMAILGLAFLAQCLILGGVFLYNLTLIHVAASYTLTFAIYSFLIHGRIFQLWSREKRLALP